MAPVPPAHCRGNGLDARRWAVIGDVRVDRIAGVLAAMRDVGIAACALAVMDETTTGDVTQVRVWVDRARYVRADNVLLAEVFGGGP